MSRDEDSGRLLEEMSKVTKSVRGKQLGEFQIIEMACARLGWFPSYGYRLLKTGFVAQPERRKISATRIQA